MVNGGTFFPWWREPEGRRTHVELASNTHAGQQRAGQAGGQEVHFNQRRRSLNRGHLPNVAEQLDSRCFLVVPG